MVFGDAKDWMKPGKTGRLEEGFAWWLRFLAPTSTFLCSIIIPLQLGWTSKWNQPAGITNGCWWADVLGQKMIQMSFISPWSCYEHHFSTDFRHVSLLILHQKFQNGDISPFLWRLEKLCGSTGSWIPWTADQEYPIFHRKKTDGYSTNM